MGLLTEVLSTEYLQEKILDAVKYSVHLLAHFVVRQLVLRPGQSRDVSLEGEQLLLQVSRFGFLCSHILLC